MNIERKYSQLGLSDSSGRSDARLESRKSDSTHFSASESRGVLKGEVRVMSIRNSVGSIIERFSATGVALGFGKNREFGVKAIGSITHLGDEGKFIQPWLAKWSDDFEPNQALEPTAMLVMPRACARVTPSTAVAHL